MLDRGKMDIANKEQETLTNSGKITELLIRNGRLLIT